MAQARFSVRMAVAEGFDFWRQNWKKAAGPLTVAALAAGAASTNVVSFVLIGTAIEFFALILVHAVFYRIAFADLGAESVETNGPLGFQWGRLEGRLLAVSLLIGVIFAITMIVAVFLVTVLVSGASEGAPPPPQTTDFKVMMDALTPEAQLALAGGLLAMMVVMLLIWARLSLAPAATAATNRITVLGSLPMTRGATLRLAAVWLLVRAPVFVLVVLAAQFGLMVGNPQTGLIASLVVGVIGVFFIEPILVGALAYIYRRLSAPDGAA